jgi:hypothetical protein
MVVDTLVEKGGQWKRLCQILLWFLFCRRRCGVFKPFFDMGVHGCTWVYMGVHVFTSLLKIQVGRFKDTWFEFDSYTVANLV